MFWKVFIASVTVIIAVLLQLQLEQPCIIAHEEVVLSGTRQEAFEFMTDIEKYHKWHPGLGPIEAADSKKTLHIGKVFFESGRYPIIGDVKYKLVITNYSPSTFLSFSSDSILLPLYEITLKDEGAKVSRVYIKVVSRRYSYLFNYAIAPLTRFAYKQQLLQALFNLRMLFRKD
ncbi:uncharacterized protein LOC135498573 [Lineus longissimus]|uniref:uncharacterized protein LOC135498573 n=1 Tax=Lineus longissimus TaxID=88925 RepID=UPI002B4DCB97